VQEVVCPKVATLKTEKARSDRRAQLETAIASTAKPVSQLPAIRDADPLAGAAATYAAAMGWKLDAGKLLPWLALVPVLFLELGSALAVVVARSATGPATSPVSRGDLGSDTEILDQPAPPPGPVQKTTKPKRKDRRPPPGAGRSGPPPRGLAGTLKVLQGGAVQGSQRAIARAIGTSKTTVQRAMQLLAEPSFAAA
jgi:hypothetical protein